MLYEYVMCEIVPRNPSNKLQMSGERELDLAFYEHSLSRCVCVFIQ